MRLAVVLLNLGGPDKLSAVKPFLFNLFKDPAILHLPAPVRIPLAALIARSREKTAQANYARIGGASPLLPETQAQARELTAAIKKLAPADEVQVFISMRYWAPFAAETAREVAAYQPDQVVLLPLYPQYSTTTTASSLGQWKRTYRGPGRVREICCYPRSHGLVEAHVEAILETWLAAGRPDHLRLLFSAHGLPQKVVDAGDPYRAQVEATAASIAARLPYFPDWQVCYQSRVGRLKWLEPYTDAEIRRAGHDGKGVLIAPIAFVSEHIETLVELDHDYANLAREVGATPYLRAPAPGVRQPFIEDLAEAVITSLGRIAGPGPYGPWLCPAGLAQCACQRDTHFDDDGSSQGQDIGG